MTLGEFFNPWRAVRRLKLRNEMLQDQLDGSLRARLIHETCALSAYRSLSGANRGAKRLHDKNVKLQKENTALKAVIRTLKHKLGEE